jgi:hypothetical protein
VAVHEHRKIVRERKGDGGVLRRGRGQVAQVAFEKRAVVARVSGRLDDEGAAFEQLAADVESGRGLLLQFVAPGGERVGEGLYCIDITCILGEWKRRRPAVIVHVPHLDLGPIGVVAATVLEERGQFVVPVFEDIGGDLEDVADFAFDRIATAIEFGRDVLDDDRAWGCGDFGGCWRNLHFAKPPWPERRSFTGACIP